MAAFRPTKPKWQDDGSALNCFICDTVFTLFLRRHHCRSCGRVCCDSCSGGRAKLPYYGYSSSQRVCDVCMKGFELRDEDTSQVGSSSELTNDRLLRHWIRMATVPALRRDLQHRARCGVPNAIRGVLWATLSGASDVMQKNVGLYSHLCAQEIDPSLRHSIQSDVGRTFPNHPLFETDGPGQSKLYNVLHAYTNFKQYVQNMSYIVAILLIYLDEEMCFWVFAQLMKHYHLQPLFEHAVPDCIRNYGDHLKAIMPDMSRHLDMHGVSIEIFASQWLRTLFAQQFDLALVVRLWDMMFVDGFPFIYKIPIALLKLSKQYVMETSGADLLFSLKNLPQQIQSRDYDEIILEVLRFPSFSVPDLDSDSESMSTS